MMLRWLFVDPYIAYKIPEIRWLIARSYVLRLIRNLVVTVSLIICIPFIAITLLGDLASIICKIINIPGRGLARMHSDAIDVVRDTMTVEDIRFRAYGEMPPRIIGLVSKTDDSEESDHVET